MKIVTHDSGFHTDDVFAVATLLLVSGEGEVVRSRDPQVWATADYLVDTGMQYDPARHMFDHHQPSGAGKRENGIPYASFGLVWEEYGRALAGGEKEAILIDKRLVQSIDAHDNGFSITEEKMDGVKDYTIGDFIGSFVTSHDPKILNELFLKMVEMAKELILREIVQAKKFILNQEKILSYYDKAIDKRLVIFDEELFGWKEVLSGKPDVLYGVHPRPDGKWTLRALQNIEYIPRKSLPQAWAGLENENLQQVTGVADALFCHKNVFMAAARSKEGAIKLAELALNA